MPPQPLARASCNHGALAPSLRPTGALLVQLAVLLLVLPLVLPLVPVLVGCTARLSIWMRRKPPLAWPELVYGRGTYMAVVP